MYFGREVESWLSDSLNLKSLLVIESLSSFLTSVFFCFTLTPAAGGTTWWAESLRGRSLAAWWRVWYCSNSSLSVRGLRAATSPAHVSPCPVILHPPHASLAAVTVLRLSARCKETEIRAESLPPLQGFSLSLMERLWSPPPLYPPSLFLSCTINTICVPCCRYTDQHCSCWNERLPSLIFWISEWPPHALATPPPQPPTHPPLLFYLTSPKGLQVFQMQNKATHPDSLKIISPSVCLDSEINCRRKIETFQASRRDESQCQAFCSPSPTPHSSPQSCWWA